MIHLSRPLGFLFYAVLAALAVAAGVLAQGAELSYLGFFLLFILLWVFALLLFRPSVTTTLLFIAAYHLKPSPYGMYICLAMLITAFLLERLSQDRNPITIPYPWLLFILFAAGTQAIVRAKVMQDGLEYYITTIITPIIALITIPNSRRKSSELVVWSRLIVYICVILGIIGVVMAILNPLERLGSLWITAMTINGFYLLGFFFALANSAGTQNRKAKYLYMLAAFIILMGMMYTYTRITLLAIVFGLIFLSFRMKNMRKLLFLFILLVPVLIPSSMMSRIQFSVNSDASLIIRLIAWYNALHVISGHFLQGIGFNTWQHIYQSMVPYQILYAEHPHNVFLRVMVETGIFGFIAYFALIVSIIVGYYKACVKKQKEKFAFTIFAAVLALLFACLTDVFIQQMGVSLPFWITLALMYKSTINAEIPPPLSDNQTLSVQE